MWSTGLNHLNNFFWTNEFWTCVTVTLVSALIIRCWNRKNLPPGPWGLPILGYLPFLDPKHAYLTLTSLSKRYGPIYSLKMGKIFTVVITDPKIIRQAFNNDALSGRADLYLAHGIMQGHGVIAAEGQHWKEQRKFVITFLKNFGATKFGQKRFKMEELIKSGVDNFIERLNNFSVSNMREGFDIMHPLMDCIGNIINKILFGRSWNDDDNVWVVLQYYSEEGLKQMGEAAVINFLPFLRFLPKYGVSLKFVVDGLNASHDIYQSIIDQHSGDEDDVIGAFIRERNLRGDDLGSFTSKQLRYLVGDLFGAGVDTSLTSISWFLLLVAKYPEVQVKIQDELDEVCGHNSPKLDDLPRLRYLEAALTESMRIRSVVPMGVPHGATMDCTIESYHIPKGSMIIPLVWAVHMDPEKWPEPHIFKPERFLNKDGEIIRQEAFMPFQLGKRICPGEEFGRMILFLFASNVLKNFNIKLPKEMAEGCDDPLEGVFDMLLKPKDPRIVVKRRKMPSISDTLNIEKQ